MGWMVTWFFFKIKLLKLGKILLNVKKLLTPVGINYKIRAIIRTLS